jgi:hypothetical protein
MVHLDYHHSYPTLRNGEPFWNRFDHESADAYGAFAKYCEQPGIRSLHEIPSYQRDLMNEWYHLYCWGYRAQAYDLFKSTHHIRMRVNRIMNTENVHFLEAEKHFNRVTQALSTLSADDWQKVEPEKLVKVLDTLAKLQRVSAGLPALTALDESKAPKPMSVEVIARQVAQNGGIQREENDEEGVQMEILRDPAILGMAQELIIKVTK